MTSATADAYLVRNADGDFGPTPLAGGHWGESMISCPAVAGLAAWALEKDFGESGFLPARFTIDLLKPARQVAATPRNQAPGAELFSASAS